MCAVFTIIGGVFAGPIPRVCRRVRVYVGRCDAIAAEGSNDHRVRDEIDEAPRWLSAVPTVRLAAPSDCIDSLVLPRRIWAQGRRIDRSNGGALKGCLTTSGSRTLRPGLRVRRRTVRLQPGLGRRHEAALELADGGVRIRLLASFMRSATAPHSRRDRAVRGTLVHSIDWNNLIRCSLVAVAVRGCAACLSLP
jgi:hypothetical protein